MLTTTSVSRLFEDFNHLNVMVIGDVMIDAYLIGSVDRISPEAPVPIVNVTKRENRLGGAANVGLNVKSLGATTYLCSMIGTDRKGDTFLDMLDKEQLSKEGIVQSDQRITTTKFRIIGNNAQMLRVDEEQTTSLLADEQLQLANRIEALIQTKEIHVIIFQDYDKGVIDGNLISRVVALARKKNIPIVVDPKKKNFNAYHHVTIFKPNLKEIKEGLNLSFSAHDTKALEDAVRRLQDSNQADIVLTTLSEKGVFMRSKNGKAYEVHHIPAHIRNIADVSGAGDTVISVAACCTALGIDAVDMASISNLAGGIVCEDVGVVPINKSRLHEEVIHILSQ